MADEIQYNDPIGGTPSSVDANFVAGQPNLGDNPDVVSGEQIRTDYYHKKVLVDLPKEQYFSAMADVTNMPKNYGKRIKFYQMVPMLDDRNINDQGIDAGGVATGSGNLYGSSKDIGTIVAKLPTLTETGGRVNRVGYTRQLIQGDLEKLGIFHEITQEAMDFDSMSDLYERISRELILGANEVTEDVLQMDLINGAGITFFGGVATAKIELTGEGADPSLITYADLQKLDITMDNTRTPKVTKMLVGSRMIDTATVNHGRVLYVGSELIPSITKMTDHFGNAAFVGVEHYGYAGDYKKGVNLIHGEIGKVANFRIVVVPEMQHEASAGAPETVANLGYRATAGAYDAFPMLCIGSGSFTTIGFQTSGNSTKFKIVTKMPGREVAQHNDPFGEVGFSSIKWFYSTVIQRPERLALAWSVAEQ